MNFTIALGHTHYGKLLDCSNIAGIVLKRDQKSGQILQSGNEGSSGQIPFLDITSPVRNTRIVIFDLIASTIRATHYILNMSLLDQRRNFLTPFSCPSIRLAPPLSFLK
jgi:hypothetical protein